MWHRARRPPRPLLGSLRFYNNAIISSSAIKKPLQRHDNEVPIELLQMGDSARRRLAKYTDSLFESAPPIQLEPRACTRLLRLPRPKHRRIPDTLGDYCRGYANRGIPMKRSRRLGQGNPIGGPHGESNT